MPHTPMTRRLLALSVVDAIRLWTEDRNRGCLPTKTSFDPEWFDDFGMDTRRTKPKTRIPLSLISKIAFFLRPDQYVPLDRFSLRGLRKLSGARLDSRRYEHYLDAFNRAFDGHHAAIRTATTSDWAKSLADEMGCRPTVLRSSAFRRKVLDNVLMRLGGRGR